jgi:hypothetical protein
METAAAKPGPDYRMAWHGPGPRRGGMTFEAVGRRVCAYHDRMLSRFDHNRLLRYAGLFTWGVTGIPLLFLTIVAADAGTHSPALLEGWRPWLAWGTFGLCYAWLTRELGRRRITLFDHPLLLLLAASAIAISYYSQSGLGSVLLMLSRCSIGVPEGR